MRDSKSVFLVDDNEQDQNLFVLAIKQIENTTLYDVAHNGKEALAKLENKTVLPDLIFLDINMPVMDGIECLTEISKKPEIRHIIVIILSSETRHVELTRKLGAKAFINKSWDYKVFKEQLEQIIHLDFITDSHIAEQTFRTALSGF